MDGRVESQASLMSQSQYSESTVLGADFAETELFDTDEPPFKGPYPTKLETELLEAMKTKSPLQNSDDMGVEFGKQLKLPRSNTIDEMRKQAAQPQGKAEMLMARLVDRPANSQALKVNNPQLRKPVVVVVNTNGQTKQKQSEIISTTQTNLQPRPPSGKTGEVTGGSFRTTMFKRDYQRKQNIIKAKQNKPLDETPVLSVQMLHKPKVPEPPKSEISESEASEISKDDVFAELEELMGPGVDVVVPPKFEMLSEPATPEMEEEKTVTFVKSEPKSPDSARSPPPMSAKETTKITEEDVMRVTGEIPIIEKRTRPGSGSRPSSGSRSVAGSRPGSGIRPGSASKPQTAARTLQKDPSLVLSYLKKNMYDDTTPDNDDCMYHLKRLREKLGWKTEIPRHAPGCKETMETLKNIPDDEKEASKMKQDDGDFVYCLPRNRHDKRGRYDPYDLQVVSPNESRSQKVYWTISASFITRVMQDPNGEGESFNIPALWWLWERRLFYSIFKIPVFVKFRIWKTFKMWKKAIRLQKSGKSQTKLYKSLFVANEVLQGCLIHIRSLCEAASDSLTGVGKGESAISLVKLDKSLTLTLDEFKLVQKDQNVQALKQLSALRDKVIDIAWESCATVAEMEGITHGIRQGSPRRVKINVPTEEPKDLSSKALRIQAKYGVVPLSEKKEEKKTADKPTYAQIAEWRKILNRLASFLKSVDYLVLEMLRRLVVTATKHLLEHLVSAYNVTEEEEVKSPTNSESPTYKSSKTPTRIAVVELQKQYKRAARIRANEDVVDDDESDRSDSTMTTTTIRSRPLSRASSTASRIQQRNQTVTKSGYIIPHYDFDQPELHEGPPDVDEVLEEIKQQDVVEEFSAPVFHLQLVLSVPQDSQERRKSSSSDLVKTASSHSSYLKQALFDDSDAKSGKKTVKFQQDETDSEYESGSSGSGEEGETGSEGEDEDEDGSGEDLAYPEDKRKSAGKAYVSLSPNEQEFKLGIRQIISGFENTVAQFVSMTREPRLSVFCKPPMFDLKLNFDEEEQEEMKELIRPWPDLEFVFGDDPEYQGLLNELGTYVTMEMELVKQYATNFEHFCGMVDKCLRLHLEESMARRPWSTNEFSTVLATHTEMIRQMKKMSVLRRVAMIQVHSKNYRESCLPHPENLVSRVNKALPIIANKRNEDLLTIIKGASKKLDRYPKSVEEFVEHLSFLGKMSSELPALEREFEIVNKLFTIAKDYNVQVTDEELALYQTLGPDFITLKNIILYCDAKKDENIRKFSHDLDALIYNISSKLMDLKNQVRDPDLLHTDTNALGALETIKFLQEEVQALSIKARSYASYQERFGSSLSQTKRNLIGEEYMYMNIGKKDDHSAQEIQADLAEVERDLTLRRLLWQSQEEWTKLVDEWTATSFDALPVETLQKNVNRYSQTVFMLEKGLPHNEVVPRLKEKVMDFKQGMPVITSLRNQFLRQRHWQQIERLIGKTIGKDKSFTLGSLLEMNIFKHKEKIQDISTTASNEATLENMLQKIVDIWKNTDFRYVAHTGRDTFIIAGADDIMAQLEDSQVTIGTIRGSRYVGPIKAQVEEWERKLNIFAKTLEEWMACQRNWLYLEQIFSTPDIQKQLKPEYTMFSQVDKSWKDIMRQVQDRPNAMKCATQTGMLETLQFCNQSLEKIQKCLEEYLDSKRLSFPRFYFLSNDELLEILGQSKEPNAVQPHLGKCFGNIKSLEIRTIPRHPPLVHSMMSAEGEVVNMTRSVRARGAVEMWLSNVEAHMFETVKRHLKLGLADWLGIKLQEWVLKHPGQVVLTVAQIMFNKDVVKCFDQSDPRAALIDVLEKSKESLNKLAGLVSSSLQPHQTMSIEALLTIDVHNRDIISNLINSDVNTYDDFEWKREKKKMLMTSIFSFSLKLESLNKLAGLVSSSLQPHQTMSIEALLTIDVHNRDIISNLIKSDVNTYDDFEWKRQLRYEWDETTNNCQVYQSNASFQYGYEYLGCSSRLVITPLTDRCYLTLTGALHLHLGGSPAGPAGTGKTETVKDLAKAMGKQCVVFNCSEGLDYKMLGKFFSGLSQSGSWCCFDEFNRIDLEVLSVVAQQILTIKTAKDAGSLRFVFEGKEIKLNPTCGYFITMNPSYAGRVELPDNLKSLFRQVAMMVPDYSQIAEIMLFSEGFQDAKSLSGKIVNLYQLASRQLSQQDHYDFGMRAIKSVLVMAGHGRLHAQQKVELTNVRLTEKEEAYILIHSLRDANLPKFLAEDVPLFESILADLFPGVTPPEPDHGVLEKAINMSVRDQGLQLWPHQIDKVKQFYNQILVRHGVMLVGPTGGGKTTVRSILQKALIMLPTISPQENMEDRKKVGYVHNRAKKGHCETFTVNPKCVKLGELYGETDPNTYDWTDGLIAMCVRKFSKELTRIDLGESRPGTSSTMTEMTRVATKQLLKKTVTILNPNTGAISEVATDNEGNLDKEHSGGVLTDWRWLVLDGPVDTLWVENLNTVLDDSKVLCLASGERISLSPGMRLIFEVDNLSQASPATISRCAMVYMDPVDLGWKPYVKTWIQRLPRDLPDSGKTHLQKLFDYSIEKGLKFFHKYNKYQCVPAPDMSIISCLCHILSAFFDFMGKHGGFGNPDKDEPSVLDITEGRSESRASSRSSGRTSRSKGRSKHRHLKRPAKIKEEKELEKMEEKTAVSAGSKTASISVTNKSQDDKSTSDATIKALVEYQNEQEKGQRRRMRDANLFYKIADWSISKREHRKSRLLSFEEFVKKSEEEMRQKFSKKWTSASGVKQYYLQKNPNQLTNLLGKLFVFAYTWSIGGNFKRQEDLDEDDTSSRRGLEKAEKDINICNEFDNFMRELFEVEPPLGVRLPTGNRTIYSYFIDMESGGFVPWDALVPSTKSLIEKGAMITIGETLGVSMDQKKTTSDKTEIVPTVDVIRFSFLTSLLITNKHPVLITGESGVGKSAVINYMLERLSKDGGTSTKTGTILGSIFNFSEKGSSLLENISSLTKWGQEEEDKVGQDTSESGVGKSAVINYMLERLSKDGGTSTKTGTILGSIFNFSEKGSSLLENISSLTKWGQEEEDKVGMDILLGARPKTSTGIISSMIQFSAQTTSARLQAQIRHNLIQKGRNTLGAPKGRKVTLFVDDLNMPAPEEYGAQPPLELLRQFLELNGFYDTVKNTWKEIIDVTVVAACGPPGGGRNPVSPRLLKNFCMLAFPQPSTRSLQHIYQVQLGRFFQDGNFSPEVSECLVPLVSVSISLYYCMCRNMLPTPTKSHYTFNVRDLSKVIQGMLQANHSVIVSKDNAAQLFAHEATRVFHDRLISTEDRELFYQFLSDNLHDYFKVKWSPEQLMQEHVIFGDFFDLDDASSARVYRPITDQSKIRQTLEEFYMRMNFGNTKASQMVFFRDAIDHICRAARIFSQPGGHMILVGLDGCGKSTVAHLASFISGCELFKLTLHRGYGTLEFREDIKKVFLHSGLKGEKVVFLLTDADIVKESFLEDINCILNSGEVPDLFDQEEMDNITMELKQEAVEADIPDTRHAVYNFFIQRVLQNLHVVLTLSPAGGRFRQRCRMNPALINCCTIDWYDEWDEEASLNVAEVFFENAEFIADKDTDIQELKKKVGALCVEIHKSVAVMAGTFWQEMRRHYYSTPSSYMELIRLYSKLLKENKAEFMNNKNRLLVGLFKLSEANSLVGTMKEEFVSLGPRIVQKQKDTEVLLVQLEKDREAVNEVRAIVEHEEGIMKKEKQIVQDYADECEQDLKSVIPALQEAVEALETLDKASISEIRVYNSPPFLVSTVLNAVCVLFQRKPDWPTAKMMLGDPNFLKKLLQFDKNSLPDRVFLKLKRYTKDPEFKPDFVGRVSLACRSICQWVLALEHYNEVYKMVKPKQKRVEEAREALKLAENSLAQKQASLKKIQDHFNTLTEKCQESINERESLQQQQILIQSRLKRAEVLIGALQDEKVRWAESVNELDTKLQGLVGDTLVAAASVCYIGPFTAKYRKLLINKWVEMSKEANVPITKTFDLIKNTTDAHQVLIWQNEGLPLDTHSTANAVMVKKGNKWPLMIDPQGQAASWIQQMEGVRLKVVSATDPNFMRTLESSIRVGEAMLLKDVTESLDPALRPVLMHETFRRGGLLVIKLGDTEIEYNQNFRLYMTTSMSNPHYLPAVYIQANIINFTVTFEGLQEQLLSAVVKQERPQLEAQRSELLESITSDLQFLRDLEDKSLGLLQKSEGHILDDQDLVDTLQQSKGMAGEIYDRIAQSEETEKRLNLARKRYLPVATRGSTLYFVLADLSTIDVMYQFSLDWFQDMFIAAISGHMSIKEQLKRRTSQAGVMVGTPRRQSIQSGRPPLGTDGERRTSEDKGSGKRRSSVRKLSVTVDTSSTEMQDPVQLKKHMLEMINRLTSSIYRVVSVALFAHHQLTFSFMLASSIMRSNSTYEDIAGIGAIPLFEWKVFLQGSIMANMMSDKELEEHDGLSPMERLESQAQSGIKDSKKHKTPPRWITESQWRQCQHLDATMPEFNKLCRSIMSNYKQWKLFETSEHPYELMRWPYDPNSIKLDDSELTEHGDEHGITLEWEKLPLFHRLILIQILRPDSLTSSCNVFVKDTIGEKYLSAGSFDLKEIYEESTAKTPLIFILSPSCDPGAQLLRFAKDLRGSALHLDMISLGRGQGPKAEELIAKAQILKGRWVFLQNCHLAASWMPKLKTIVENFNRPTNDEVDPQFRLWLSSKPDPSFPISILQTGMKMTIEPPQGLKSNMLRAFGSGGTGIISEKLFEDASYGMAWKKLLFGLCLFNSVIHERKKYGALGWNIAYEFNDSDLEVSILQLQMLLSEHKTIPWEALSYLIGGVTYGGRVTDEWDYRCLHAQLGRFFCPEALEQDYSYSPNKIYRPVKDTMSFNDVTTYIESLPNYDSPDVFGMTENAEKACREMQAKDLVNTIVSVQPRLSMGLSGSEKSSDELVNELAQEILNQLPETVEELAEGDVRASSTGSTLFQIRVKHILTKELPDFRDKEKNKLLEGAVNAVMGNSALITVLRQEIDRFNNLLYIIHTSLRSLILAIKGEVIMSEPLEEAYNALLTQKVPQKWKSASYESRKPLGGWIQNLFMRVDFFAQWAEMILNSVEKLMKPVLGAKSQQADIDFTHVPRSLPYSYWLSGFYFPQGFLTGVLQNHARKLGISIDSLQFEFTIKTNKDDTVETLSDLKQKLNIKESAFKSGSLPDDGVMIFGLYLDGARWGVNEGCLQDSLPGQRFSKLPEIHFKPVQKQQSRAESNISDVKAKQPTTNVDSDKPCFVYECPLYRTSERAGTLSSTGHSTNFVTAVNLPSDKHPNFWVMRGIALLCQPDE